MLFAIHAYEQMYGGLHGMETYLITDAASEKEAERIAVQESYEIMDSYSDIYESFEDAAESEELEPYSDEWDDYISECRDDNVDYEIYTITNITNESVEELEEKFYNEPKTFIKKYCGGRI